MTEEKKTEATPSEKLRIKIPRNSSIVTSVIVFLLMALSLAVGISVGPMITEWMNATNTQNPTTDTSGHNHGTPATTSASESEASSSGWYVCPMHPWVVQPEPGTCPICTMDLTPLDPDRFSGEIAIDPVVVQNIGVRVQPAILGSIENDLRTIGTIAYDETKVVDVNLKVSGWVEKIYTDFEGAVVKKGEKLLEIYARDLYATQEEYLLLWKNRNSNENAELLKSARQRLKLYDITDEQIAELEERGSAGRTMTIYAPASGFVVTKNVNAGQKVSPGTILYRIADLRTVWLMAMVYEHQLPAVKINSTASITFPYLPGESFSGKVSYIYPTVDEKTRVVRIRLELNNRSGKLKPGMYANVEIGGSSSQEMKILAPREAVIDTGKRKVAFVSLGQGRFEPRNVATGQYASGGMLEILSGINPGENVVVSGQFLLDSESRIRESLAKMIKGNSASEQLPQLETIAGTATVTLQTEGQQILANVVDTYLEIQDQLYTGSTKNLAARSATLIDRLNTLSSSEVSGQPHFWHMNEAFLEIKNRANKLSQTTDLALARQHFGYLGYSFNKLLSITGMPGKHADTVMGVRCGMFNEAPDGGIWLQIKGKARNPFYGEGSGMASCSSDTWALPAIGGKSKPKLQPAMQTTAVAETQTQQEPIPTKESDGLSDSQFSRLLTAYLSIHQQLYQNDLEHVGHTAMEITAALKDAKGIEIKAVLQYAQQLTSPKDLESARNAFGYIGIALNALLKQTGVPAALGKSLVTKHCGMYPNAPEDGLWVQVKGKTMNPFFGADHMMAACAPEEWDLPVREN